MTNNETLQTAREKVTAIKKRMYTVQGISITVKIYRANITKRNPFRQKYNEAVKEFKAAQRAFLREEMAEWRAGLEPVTAAEFAENFTTPPTDEELDILAAADIEWDGTE